MPLSATVRQKRFPATSVCTSISTGAELCRMLLPSRFSSNRSSRARSTQNFACSAASVCCSDTSQVSACGLSQNCATSSRNSGPAANSCLRRGCVPYSSLLVRFRSSIRVRSFSLWVRMPPAFLPGSFRAGRRPAPAAPPSPGSAPAGCAHRG